jgi:SPRY domain
MNLSLKPSSGHSALAVGVGLSTKLARSTNRMPGWYTEEKGSRTWGFHGDDGCLYGYPNVYQKPFHDNLRFGYNDIIGCAWDTEEGTIQYTKNGGLLGKFHLNPPRASAPG